MKATWWPKTKCVKLLPLRDATGSVTDYTKVLPRIAANESVTVDHFKRRPHDKENVQFSSPSPPDDENDIQIPHPLAAVIKNRSNRLITNSKFLQFLFLAVLSGKFWSSKQSDVVEFYFFKKIFKNDQSGRLCYQGGTAWLQATKKWRKKNNWRFQWFRCHQCGLFNWKQFSLNDLNMSMAH